MDFIIAFHRFYKKLVFERVGVTGWLDLANMLFTYSCVIAWILIMIVAPPVFFIGFLIAFASSTGVAM